MNIKRQLVLKGAKLVLGTILTSGIGITGTAFLNDLQTQKNITLNEQFIANDKLMIETFEKMEKLLQNIDSRIKKLEK